MPASQKGLRKPISCFTYALYVLVVVHGKKAEAEACSQQAQLGSRLPGKGKKKKTPSQSADWH